MTNLQAIDLLKGLEQSLDDYCELNDEGKTAFGMAITALELFGNSEQLPSAQSEQRWIPVAEALPEEGKVVLTQAKFKDDVKMAVSSRIDYNYWTTWGTRDINIVAWKPLPEPYRKGGDT